MIKLHTDSKVLVLTGAGISAESGIKTFRDSGGLWENHLIEDVASVEGFTRNPGLVWDFYQKRYLDSVNSLPNAAHYALVKLEEFLGSNFTLVTQNVDGLHTKAGSKHVLEMHGSLQRCYCTKCKAKYQMQDIPDDQPVPTCEKCKAMLRPDIVWFGEIPYFLAEIETAVKNCEYLIVIGTSGFVYPAAGFVMCAKLLGSKTIAINLAQPDNLNFIDEFHQGKSGELLPELVQQWIA